MPKRFSRQLRDQMNVRGPEHDHAVSLSHQPCGYVKPDALIVQRDSTQSTVAVDDLLQHRPVGRSLLAKGPYPAPCAKVGDVAGGIRPLEPIPVNQRDAARSDQNISRRKIS